MGRTVVAMSASRTLLQRLADEFAASSASPPASWTSDPMLAALCGPAEAVTVCRRRWRTDSTGVNRLVSALLHAGDPVSCAVVLAALGPGLDAAIVGLAGRWRVDRREVEAELVANAWARISEAAGTRLGWPARILVDSIRDQARTALRRAARRADRDVVLGVAGSAATPDGLVAVEDRVGFEGRARAAGLSPAALTLVWATRVEAVGLAEAASASGRSLVAARAMRARAERALRASA
jgi:hypothetical protein